MFKDKTPAVLCDVCQMSSSGSHPQWSWHGGWTPGGRYRVSWYHYSQGTDHWSYMKTSSFRPSLAITVLMEVLLDHYVLEINGNSKQSKVIWFCHDHFAVKQGRSRWSGWFSFNWTTFPLTHDVLSITKIAGSRVQSAHSQVTCWNLQDGCKRISSKFSKSSGSFSQHLSSK